VRHAAWRTAGAAVAVSAGSGANGLPIRVRTWAGVVEFGRQRGHGDDCLVPA
jgi:hypothetical protein